jgi:hypothetical protein
MSRLLAAAIVLAMIGCGGSERAQPPASAYGPPMQPGQPSYGPAPAPAPPPPPPPPPAAMLCNGTPLGGYGALAERDPQNLRICRNEPAVGAFSMSIGAGGALLVRPDNAPPTTSCTATVTGCTLRATCDDRLNGEFARRADWEITFQGTHYTGLVKLIDNTDKHSLPCSSRVLVSGDRVR